MSRVIKLFAEGMTMRQIADDVDGVVHTTISRRLREIWVEKGFRSAREYRESLVRYTTRSPRPRKTTVNITRHEDGRVTYQVVGREVVRR